MESVSTRKSRGSICMALPFSHRRHLGFAPFGARLHTHTLTHLHTLAHTQTAWTPQGKFGSTWNRCERTTSLTVTKSCKNKPTKKKRNMLSRLCSMFRFNQFFQNHQLNGVVMWSMSGVSPSSNQQSKLVRRAWLLIECLPFTKH